MCANPRLQNETLFIVAAIASGLILTGGNGARTTAEAQADAEPLAHREAVAETDIGDPEPQKTSAPGALDRVWTDETDPFRRCAAKALAGEFGTLRPWQRDAYTYGLATGVTCRGLAKVTAYGHRWESARMAGGVWTASGSYVHLGGCAANPELPFGALVWTTRGLRYVTDRGGWVKLGYVRGVGYVTTRRETANLDYYTHHNVPTLRHTPWALVKAKTDRSVWHRTERREDLP